MTSAYAPDHPHAAAVRAALARVCAVIRAELAPDQRRILLLELQHQGVPVIALDLGLA
jgi:hypothetical protein